ncbi:MAG: thioredoxin family protein [Pyrinomonadaceae bacterium]|nr:thioredoxin family protein [Pyrinomonadaceae bacterium]
MKKRRNTLTFSFALLLAMAFASVSLLPEIGSARTETKNLAIGAKAENFSLPDADGKQRSFNELKGKKGTVVIFVSARCPVSDAYAERMSKLAADYKSKDVNVIGINSNAPEPTDEIKKYNDEKLSFPVLIDKNNVIADKFGATVTPETYFFDAGGKLVYHGRIDNDKAGTSITASDLRDSLEATLSGKPIAKSEAPAFGCSIKRATK